MSESQYFCPRLIDYLAIVGAHPDSSKRSSLYELQNNGTGYGELGAIGSMASNNEDNFYIQNPELLRRYPAEDHKDFILPETMSYFCQPEGCVSFRHGRSESNKVTSFVFTLTDKDTTRTRYGVCVNFYRRINQCFTNTRKTSNVCDDPYLEKNQRSHPSIFLKCHSTSSFCKSISQENQSSITGTTRIQSQPESQDLYSLTSLCLLSHHPMFSNFRKCLFYLKNIIDSCNRKINRSKKDGHKSKECIWSLLTGLLTQSNSPRIIQYIKEIEMWILRLLSSPVPIPGKTKLEVHLFSQYERQPPLTFALPDHTRFSLIDFPLHLPLELLGVDTCLYVLTMILLESKVVFQSKDYNALSMSVMALIALMYPLQYMFTVIPLLPTSLQKSEMLFESPVPYVVGVPSSFFSAKRDFRFPKDVWIVDLDSNKITPPIVINREDAIPQLPKSESITLKNNLKSALSGLSRNNVNNKTSNYYSDKEVTSTTRLPNELKDTEEEFLNRKTENLQLNRNNDINVGNSTNRGIEIRRQTSANAAAYSYVDIDSVDISIRVAMVRFFLSGDVLANLTEHSRTLRLYPRPVVFFQINSFLKSRPNPSLFTCQLSRTQAVDYFAEWALTPNNVVFQRIQTGVDDPLMIGDKPKWYAHALEPIVCAVWHDKCSIGRVMNVDVRSSSALAAAEDGTSSSDDDDDDDDDDERPPTDVFKVNAGTNDRLENHRLNIGPIVQGVHTAYEPPVILQLPAASDDSPDEDGTVESVGSKSIGSSPSSSHSDMSSPMFKPESLIDIVRNSQLQQPSSQLTATAASNKLLLSRHSTGGSDSALDNVVIAQKPHSNYRPTTQTSTGSEFYQPPTMIEKKQSILSSPPSSRKGSLSSLHQQLTRQSSQNSSILEHFAYQAKELVKETARQSSQEGAGGILAHVADKLTTQAKKAAGEATKSVHEVSKSAFEASKTAAGVSKNTFDDLTYVGKSTIGDLTKSAKQVASKKGFKVGLLVESASSSQQERSFDDEITDAAISSTNQIPTNSNTEIRKSSVTSVGSGATKEFFSNITNDINGLATQTSSMFSDLFGGNKQLKNNKSSLTLPVTKTKERSSGTFPTKAGRNDLVEKSNLIHHSNPRKLNETTKSPNRKLIKPNSHMDNETFLKDVTKQILDGDGIGWLKLSRFKKLMEEEGYRNLVLSKLNRTLDNKISPSDHIDDVFISRPVWKGMLKALLAIIHGLEVSFTNQCGGGLASAFQVLEIAHTHYWAKDMSIAGFESQISSPYGSRENVQSPLQSPSIAGSPMSSVYQESRKSSQTSTSGVSEYKNSEAGKFANEIPLVDNNEPTINKSATEVFNDLMNIENTKQISTNPFLENEGEMASVGPAVVSDESSNSSSVLVNNPSFYLKRMPSNSSRNNTSFFRSAVSDSELDNTGIFKVNNKNRTQSIWSSKSSLSAGFRYHGGNLLNTASGSSSPDSGRTYLFEGILGKERSSIWNQLKFWEDVFIDAVGQERDMIGMDQGPVEMMERYKSLNQSERKRLEYDEDKLLSIMIYNLIAFMIMLNVPKENVMKIVRTLVGKSRVTNCYATEITSLVSQLPNLNGNDVDLKPTNSRQAHRQSFAVHCGDSSGELLFLEVRDDGLVLRSASGIIVSRWWYERIVNMTYSPRSKIFCLWRTANGGQLQLNKYYTRKCKDLYTRIKHSMEKAAERGQGIIPGIELGGEFPVKDMATGEGGILQVCMEGVGLLFADSKDFEFFVRLDHVRKCFTVQKKIFVLEEYNPKLKHVIQRQYESPMAGQICYAVLCVFSYIAAGHKRAIIQTNKTQRQLLAATDPR